LLFELPGAGVPGVETGVVMKALTNLPVFDGHFFRERHFQVGLLG